MKKCGIITIYKKSDEPNYGNIFQLFALNKYMNSIQTNVTFETLFFKDKPKRVFVGTVCVRVVLAAKIILSKMLSKKTVNREYDAITERRKYEFSRFLDSNEIPVFETSYRELTYGGGGRFTAYIVGSDVVWGQTVGAVNRIHFLDFADDSIKRFSYAASFGNNFIPESNVKYLKKALSRFDAVSVREKESTTLLENIGINGVEHVLDPTFLINGEEWKCMAKKPDVIPLDAKYVFVYVLGWNSNLAENVVKFAKNNGLLIVSISYANGYSDGNGLLSDGIILDDCTPENFLWLLANSSITITDSFHGMALSTNMKKNFIALRRDGKANINSRINDFLQISNQTEKMRSDSDLCNIKIEYADSHTDYHELDKMISFSKKYLENVLKIIER